MTVAVPSTRPKLTRDAVIAKLRGMAINTDRPVLLGVRGYYRDTMGAKGLNDVAIYDDAIFLLTPTRLLSFNANTDPSREHPHVATLKPGVWLYRLGTHGLSKPVAQQYPALVQAAVVSVTRAPAVAGGPRTEDKGLFGINIHRGSINSTSSEGCQTIVPTQWADFIGAVIEALRASRNTVIEYVLVEGI